MYTLEQLEKKTFKELKQIGWQLSVFPVGDRRCRQNWIDALVGVKPPLLQLLEAFPSVEAESVAEAIKVQAQQPSIEFKFGRIIYPKPTAEPIAQVTENSPGVNFDPAQFRRENATEIESYCKSFTECDRLPNRSLSRFTSMPMRKGN